MLSKEQIAKIRLARTKNIGPVTSQLLMRRYQTAQEALAAVPELSARGGRRITPAPLAEIQREIETTLELGGSYLTWGDAGYPAHLARFTDAPFVLVTLGHQHLLTSTAVAIIGARNASLNAQKLAASFARKIGEHGLSIISGLARGIDTSAHQGSLDTGTIAVIANGIDQIYPAENKDLFHQIAHKGLILTERAVGAKPSARFFPARNRIIASLSKAVLVIEAARNSGSLITAREALDRNIEVMAVPGSPLDPRSAGCNSLIQDGAHLAQNAEEIIEIIKNQTIGEPYSKFAPSIPIPIDTKMTIDESDALKAKLYENLSHDPISIDELVRVCDTSAGMLNAVLIELELAGKIYRHHGNRISRTIDQD